MNKFTNEQIEERRGIKLMGVKLTPKSCENNHVKILYYPSKSPDCPMCMLNDRYNALRRKAR